MNLVAELISVAWPIKMRRLISSGEKSAQFLNASELISLLFVMGTVAAIAWRLCERRIENSSASLALIDLKSRQNEQSAL